MELPKQAKPAMRKSSTARVAGVVQSAYPCSKCPDMPKGEVQDLCWKFCYK